MDFTSALYLGMHHRLASLQPWASFTTGRPAALQESCQAGELGRRLAALMGVEKATIAPSTLHLFWDLFGIFAQQGPRRILVERDAYPIAVWGVERAAALGANVERFRGVAHLERLLARRAGAAEAPIIVTDGVRTTRGETAPLPAYLRLAERHGGHVLVDDTQALGILGTRSRAATPYGSGGGGTLDWYGVRERGRALVAASLAKGFGAPLAVLGGPRTLIRRFERSASTRIHSSPASQAAIAAASRALDLNLLDGEHRRRRLARNVAELRRGLCRLIRLATRTLFPVQSSAPLPLDRAQCLYRRLEQEGVRSLLVPSADGPSARLTFAVTAMHTSAEIERTLQALCGIVNRSGPCGYKSS